MVDRYQTMILSMLIFALGMPCCACDNIQDKDVVYESTVVKLADNIYRIMIHFGLQPNVAVSAGLDGVLLIDTGHKETTGELIDCVNKIGMGEIRYIINTHPHGDHAGANNLDGRQVTIFGLGEVEKILADGVIHRGEGILEGRNGTSFDTYYTFQFNGEEIHLIPAPGVHSDFDLIIHFTDSKVAHIGDLFLPEAFPALEDADSYLKILDKVLDVLPADVKLIPGHGPVSSIDKLREYREMVAQTSEIVKEQLKMGKTLEQMVSENVLARWSSYGQCEYLSFLTTERWIKNLCKHYSEK